MTGICAQYGPNRCFLKNDWVGHSIFLVRGGSGLIVASTCRDCGIELYSSDKFQNSIRCSDSQGAVIVVWRWWGCSLLQIFNNAKPVEVSPLLWICCNLDNKWPQPNCMVKITCMYRTAGVHLHHMTVGFTVAAMALTRSGNRLDLPHCECGPTKLIT